MNYIPKEDIAKTIDPYVEDGTLNSVSFTLDKRMGVWDIKCTLPAVNIPEDHSADLLGMSETFSEAQTSGMEDTF